ncbi:MAG: dehydrogenase/reductase SDR family protein 7B [Rhodothermales bacterium]|jgi:dehydrogenase/reductase SDR family protein 7B
MSFSGKRVWITGASAGIGAALAKAFDSAGAHCVLSARRTERLEAVRTACDHPERHLVFPLDTTAFESHEAAAREVEASAGPIDILILNAGIGQRGGALETNLDIVRRIMDVNFTGTVSLARLVAKRMAHRHSGHVVVISSVLGRLAIPGSSSYSASKFALHGYFEALRGEVFDDGIHVTMVCPGYINTDLTIHALQADGTGFGVIDHNHTYGMPAEVCARKILTAVRRRKAQVRVGGRETWGIPLARLAPALVRRVTRGYKRK